MSSKASEPFGWQQLFILFGRLLTILSLESIPSDTMTDPRASPGSVGSCFKQRLNSGKCVDLVTTVNTQSECCAQNGYFLNRMLTQREYLNDHLIFESGTPNCVDACNEVTKPTCDGYICPEGYFCRVVNGQPSCQCHPRCEITDYLSGSICTSNLQRFKDRCQFKKAYCDSANQVFEIVPCPNIEQSFCSRSSHFLRSDQTSFWQEQPSRLIRHLIEARKRGRLWFGPERTIAGEASESMQMDPDLWRIIQSGAEITGPEDIGDGLVCPHGEFCLLRQFDGRPMCTSLYGDHPSESEHGGVCTREPFTTPKCGVDNRTYNSECELKRAGLEKQLEIRIAYDGACFVHAKCNNVVCPRPGMVCRSHHQTGQPVCLDCAKLPTDCNASFRQARLIDPKRGGAGRFGDPIWNSHTQTNGWPVVCGSNRRTYANTCFLHIVNCLSNQFVDLMSPQFCAVANSQSAMRDMNRES